MIRLRTTLVLALAAALLAFAIRIWERDAVPDAARLRRARSAFRFDPDRATLLSIRTSACDITCRRRGNRWFLVSPFEARADAAAVGRLLGALAEIPRGDIVLPPRHASREQAVDYGLDIPRARILIAEGSRTNALLVGRRSPLGDGVYVRREGTDGIARISGALLENLPSAPADLRARTLLSGAPGTVTRLELRSPTGYLQLVRAPSGEWRLHQPVAARADPTAVAALLDALFSCSIVQFAQDNVSDFTPYGLQDETTLSVVLTTDLSSPNQLLAFGDPLPSDPDLVYARLQAEPSVYAVPRAARLALARTPADLRARTLPAVDPATLRLLRIEDASGATVELARPDASAPWTLSSPVKAPADPAAVDALLRVWNAAAIETFLPPPNLQPAPADTPEPDFSRTLVLRLETPAGIVQHVLRLAPEGKDATRIRLEGDSTDCILPGRAFLDLPVDSLPYRSAEVLSVPPSDIASLTLQTPDRPAPLRCVPAPGEPAPPWADAILRALSPLRAGAILSATYVPPTAPPPDATAIVVRHNGATALQTTIVLSPDGTACILGTPLLFRLPPDHPLLNLPLPAPDSPAPEKAL